MKTLEITAAQMKQGSLILVNPSHPVPDRVEPNNLAPVLHGDPPVFLERQAGKMLAELIAFAGCDHQVVPVSGYRSLREQQALFDSSLCEHGEAFTHQYVAVPGCSEHQTGLAVDMSENKALLDPIRPAFPYSGFCQAFRELAFLFGFIERYQAGKEAITRIAPEPWHFRYVGYPHSEIIMEKGFSLEEYIAYIQQFRYDGAHLQVRSNRRTYEIFHVPVSSNLPVRVEIPEGIPYQLSGNNQDGCVVTLWMEL